MSIFKKSVIYFFVIIIVLFFGSGIIFAVSFKTIYKDIVIDAGNLYNIESALIFSIIKAESKFKANSESNAGAIGLMQIKLDTANYMRSLNGDSEIAKEELFVPENNIKLGTQYLSYLIHRFENIDTSICAYNAGETIVNNWLSDSTISDDGKTLKIIPYPETETYFNRVKFNYKIYKKMLKI